jgi:hypothetical protein
MSFKIFQQETLNCNISVATRLAVRLSVSLSVSHTNARVSTTFASDATATECLRSAADCLPLRLSSATSQELGIEKCPPNVARIPDTLEIHRIALHTQALNTEPQVTQIQRRNAGLIINKLQLIKETINRQIVKQICDKQIYSSQCRAI